MRSIFHFRTLATAAMGALLGQEAMAWCPTSTNRNITCSNCTVTLTCDVWGIGAININGTNVTFEGNWYSLNNGTSDGIYVTAGRKNTTIKNLFINNPGNAGIYAPSSQGDYLRLENIYVNNATAGVAHYYAGRMEVHGGSFWNNEYGITSTYGSTNGGWADAYGSNTSDNTRNGLHLETKPSSIITNGFYSASNGWNGAIIWSSPYVSVWDSQFLRNRQNGLVLTGSSYYSIGQNFGANNVSNDCYIVQSSGGSAYANTWGTTYGPCN